VHALLLLLLLPWLMPVGMVAVRIWQAHNRCWPMDAWQARVCCCCCRRCSAAAGPVHTRLQQRLLLLLDVLLLLLLCILLLLWLEHHLLQLLLLRHLLLWYSCAASAGAGHRYTHRSLHLQLHWLLLLLPLCELHWRWWAGCCACTNLRPPLRPALLLLLHPHHCSRGLHLWHTNAHWHSTGVTWHAKALALLLQHAAAAAAAAAASDKG
jgi:hypothetical protein